MRRRRGVSFPADKSSVTVAKIDRLPLSTDMTTSDNATDYERRGNYPSLPAQNKVPFFLASVGLLFFCGDVVVAKYDEWAYPILIAASLCALFYNSSTKRNSKYFSSQRFQFFQRLSNRCRCHSRILSNDANNNLVILSSLIVALPCFIYVTKKVTDHLATVHGDKIHKKLANDFGKLSATAMSYFLIPVSKHSILLKAAGIGEIHAVRLHIWAGCIAIFGGIIHGLYYFWIWLFLNGASLNEIIPTKECWVRDYSKDCHCRFVNLLGIICGMSFILLGLTSLWWVRRNFYRLFYYCHVTFSLILLFGLMMHYNKMILFLSPSLLYYTASNVPLFLEGVQKLCQGGVVISKVKHIANSGGCVELSFRMHSGSCTSVEDCCGKYIRLCLPKVSLKSHPFTVFSHPDHDDEVKLIFRSCGTFTKQLSSRLLGYQSMGSQQPLILASGMHTGSDQMSQALQHDTILIFAGGVGIVSYISLLSSLISVFTSRSEELDVLCSSTGLHRLQRVHVHWICRERSLVEYVIQHYFSQFRWSAKKHFTFEVHQTNQQPSAAPLDFVNEVFEKEQRSIKDGNSLAAVSIFSTFEGGKGFLQNIHAATTFACIAWGGLWTINYCYENLQEKYVIETRSLTLLALIGWSLVVSTFSLAINKAIGIRGKAAAYSKLNNTIEIECSEIVRGHSIDDTSIQNSKEHQNDEESLFSSDADPNEASFMDIISFQNGRPNIASIIQGVFKERRNDDTNEKDDIGIFLCGPTGLRDSVRIAVHECESRVGGCLKSCRNQKAVVYEEVYEL